MLDGYLPTAYSGASGGIVASENRFSGWQFRWRLLHSIRMNGTSMWRPLLFRNTIICVCMDGMYSVMTQDISLLQIHT